ncbi:MAG: hypothetical protein WD200_04895 [Candidatus Andersenbacteria bacterium]
MGREDIDPGADVANSFPNWRNEVLTWSIYPCQSGKLKFSFGYDTLKDMNENLKPHDINQFPHDEGLVVFGISMSKISNTQRAENYFSYLEEFLRKIVKTDGIGAIILYSDYLYMHTANDTPQALRAKYVESMLQHKNSFLNVLKKRRDLIPKAYTFLTWGQLLLNSREFTTYFSEIKKMYRDDQELQEYVKIDSGDKEVNENQANFILEESLVLYLIAKGKFSFPNDYIQHREKWILNCYPGKPLMTEGYLYQKNIFEFKNPDNIYENSYYDLESKLLFDLSKHQFKDF